MDLQLNDKIALVTGGSGIGRAIAEALAREGAKVIITGRHEDALQETANAVGENCSYVVADVTKAEDIDRTIVNCTPCQGHFLKTSPKFWTIHYC